MRASYFSLGLMVGAAVSLLITTSPEQVAVNWLEWWRAIIG